MSNYEIIITNKPDKFKWNVLLENSYYSMPFSSIDFIETTGRKSIFIIAVNNDNGNYEAGLPVQVRWNKFPLSLFFTTFWIDSFPSLSNEEVKDKIMNKLIEIAFKENIMQIMTSHWFREIDNSVFEKIGFIIEKTATFLIDLNQDENQISKKFNSLTRRHISKAKKENIIIKHLKNESALEYISEFYETHMDTYIKASKNKSSTMQLRDERYLRDILMNCQNSSLSIALYNNKIVCGNITFELGKKIVMYIAGTKTGHPLSGPASRLLYWESFLYFKSQGFDTYDMGGVPVNPEYANPAYGVYEFKRGFGGEYNEYFGGILIMKKLKRNIFNLLSQKYSTIRRFSLKWMTR